MPLEPPILDSRTWEDLVREARERIPRYTPEWTNLNDSDPGITLVKLQAWLAETVLYELNRLPEAAYVKFLNLLHVEPQPARAAQAELTFQLEPLKAPTDPLTVAIPKAAAVDVDDPDLATPVSFETDRSLVALNAAVGAVIVRRSGAHPLELVTRFDDKTAATTFVHSFQPFGAAVAPAPLLIGLALRAKLDDKLELSKYSQDTLPAIELDLYVDVAEPGEPDAAGTPLPAPLARTCLGVQAAGESAAAVRWQIFSGATTALDDFADPSQHAGWTDLPVRGDDSAGLTRSGHLRLQLPERATRVSPEALPAGLWEDLGLLKPPTTLAELKALLGSGQTDLVAGLEEDDWRAMHLPETELNTFTNACTEDSEVLAALNALPAAVQNALDPNAIKPERWTEIDPVLARITTPWAAKDERPRPLYWLRAVAAGAATAPHVAAIRLNTLPATAATTRQSERLGFSTGRPNQRFTLTRAPVLIDPESKAPDLDLRVDEQSGGEALWQRVEDFFAQDAEAAVYTLDPGTGAVTFGDGRRGRIPVAGAAIIGVRYRTGGGEVGNVGPGTITKIKGKIRHVAGVSNLRAAWGGEDRETLEDTLLRAPHDLRSRDRAVTAEDFSDLARQVDGVAISRAYALANRKPVPGSPGQYAPQLGAVSVVVLPISKDPTPTPSEAQIRAVCRFLDERRLVTTELHVSGPRYVAFEKLAATLAVGRDADLATVGAEAAETMLAFLHPLKGGRDGKGWPFGAPVDFADLYDRLLAVPQVRRVSGLNATIEGTDADALADVIGLPEGALPWLKPERLDLKVVYDAG
jgi:hypothetical protein